MAQVHPEMYFNAETQVTSMCFLNESQLLAGTTKGQVQLWSLKSQSLIKTLQLFKEKEPLLWMSQLLDNFIIVQARFADKIQILHCQISTEEPVVHFCKGDILPSEEQESEDKILAAFACKESTCQVINKKFESVTTIKATEANEGYLAAIKFTKELLLLAYESGNVKVHCNKKLQVLKNS